MIKRDIRHIVIVNFSTKEIPNSEDWGITVEVEYTPVKETVLSYGVENKTIAEITEYDFSWVVTKDLYDSLDQVHYLKSDYEKILRLMEEHSNNSYIKYLFAVDKEVYFTLIINGEPVPDYLIYVDDNGSLKQLRT